MAVSFAERMLFALAREQKIVPSILTVIGGLVVSLVIGCESYGPCSELRVGDEVEVEITEIYWGDSCPMFSLDEGTVLHLWVDDSLQGERCESASGTVSINGSVISGPTELEDESKAHSAFYGHYRLQEGECSVELVLSLSFDGFKDGKSKAGISVDVNSSTCDVQCSFNAHGLAVEY